MRTTATFTGAVAIVALLGAMAMLAASIGCGSPPDYDLQVVHKDAGKDAVFTLRSGKNGSWLASIE